MGKNIEFYNTIIPQILFGVNNRTQIFAEMEQKITDGQNKYREQDLFINGEILKINKEGERVNRILEIAEIIREQSEVVVCIGIGGSYLGHRAIIEISENTDREILYVGNSLSARETKKIFRQIRDRDFSVIVISKSGKTLETREAFDYFIGKLREKYGEKYSERVFIVTDENNGLLRELVRERDYKSLTIPRKIGGRFSAFTEVGLLPMAVVGIDIRGVLKEFSEEILKNDKKAKEYAKIRAFLWLMGIKIEVLASFEPDTFFLQEWWKQLFGESEGKNNGGIFPASLTYSRDLHSMGQFIQEGQKKIVETFLEFENDGVRDSELEKMKKLNNIALESVWSAHFNEGSGISVLKVKAEKLDEFNIARVMAFFMKACVYSAYISGVNPYDQNGVEKYKLEISRRIG